MKTQGPGAERDDMNANHLANILILIGAVTVLPITAFSIGALFVKRQENMVLVSKGIKVFVWLFAGGMLLWLLLLSERSF